VAVDRHPILFADLDSRYGQRSAAWNASRTPTPCPVCGHPTGDCLEDEHA
jgi:hypothetical protein